MEEKSDGEVEEQDSDEEMLLDGIEQMVDELKKIDE